MRRAQGFLTDDATFFDTAEDAEEYEARQALSKWLADNDIDVEKFFDILNNCPLLIRRYVHARDAQPAQDNLISPDSIAQTEASPPSLSRADDPGPEEEPSTLLVQPPRSDELVPDMGSSVEPEKVLNKCKVYGPRSRLPHA